MKKLIKRKKFLKKNTPTKEGSVMQKHKKKNYLLKFLGKKSIKYKIIKDLLCFFCAFYQFSKKKKNNIKYNIINIALFY